MKVKIKRLVAEAIVPSYAKSGDAGLDLVATSVKWNESKNQVTYGTGLAIEIPEGHVGLIFPRSSISKTDAALSNSVGVIDSGYRGEIMFKFNFRGNAQAFFPMFYDVGDKVGQLVIMPYPKVELEVVQELSDTDRGSGGFGSTGK
jgi:dUTP pyrophosphatase